MKKVTILTLLLFAGVMSNAQCWIQPACVNSFDVPLRDVNSVNNTTGSKCFNINHSAPQTLPNSVNFNNWNFLTFNASTDFTVKSPVNFNHSNVYVNGSRTGTFEHFNMVGKNDTLFVSPYSRVYITKMLVNNTNNVIVLGVGAQIFIHGTEYFVGGIYQGPGNGTNIAKIIDCNQLLPVKYIQGSFKFVKRLN